MLALSRFHGSCILLESLQQATNKTTVGQLSLFTFNKPKPKPIVTEEKKPQIGLVGRDFINLKHFSPYDIKQFLWVAKDLKTRIKENGEVFEPLKGKTAALVMSQNASTRTRLAIELGMSKLGGSVCFLGPDHAHLGGNESVKDTARVLAGMADIILASVGSQAVMEELADESNVPVVSGQSDLLHPLQVLADFMTVQEYFGYLRGAKIAWIGRGNNTLHSLMYGCAMVGIDLNIATPAGYEANPDVTSDALKISGKTGSSFMIGHNPVQAAYRADVIMTDSWVSMGQEEQKSQRLKDFAGFQINRKMLKEAGGDWIFLHGLPRKQEEVADDIFYGQESLVQRATENSVWTAMAVMLSLLQPYKPGIIMPKYVRG